MRVIIVSKAGEEVLSLPVGEPKDCKDHKVEWLRLLSAAYLQWRTIIAERGSDPAGIDKTLTAALGAEASPEPRRKRRPAAPAAEEREEVLRTGPQKGR